MIEDVIVSIGRVGTLAMWRFLQSAPDIVPASWFDLADIRRHWDGLDALPARVVVIVHHSSQLSILDRVPPDRLRVSWNTRCPFASARSSINWRIFQDIVTHGGSPSRDWTQLLDRDDLNAFYPAVAQALTQRDHQIIDFGEYAVGTEAGYRRLAAHHRLPLERMEIPTSQQQGLFEAFLCTHRVQLGSFSYLIVPAEGITWEDNDLYLGQVSADQAFPSRYGDGRLLSVYVAMGRPDSQWKRQVAWNVFQDNMGRLDDQTAPLFEQSRKAYEAAMLGENNPELAAMIRQALGPDLDRLMAEYPVFGQNWRPPK